MAVDALPPGSRCGARRTQTDEIAGRGGFGDAARRWGAVGASVYIVTSDSRPQSVYRLSGHQRTLGDVTRCDCGGCFELDTRDVVVCAPASELRAWLNDGRRFGSLLAWGRVDFADIAVAAWATAVCTSDIRDHEAGPPSVPTAAGPA